MKSARSPGNSATACYAARDAFHPAHNLDPGNMPPSGGKESFPATRQLVKKVSVDSEHENQWGHFAVDANPWTTLAELDILPADKP